ncbi:Sulfotransferase family protein [Pseudooceanicola antarcticus]|uniref:Sulfotransferase family protein n=1 Tax=Pseudooceanicola antarcticus TaxID=1247613 RepID=A0A285IIW7_9RHOB|nr:sulfotransferase [Pseudooceanicola antarcticus]PJE28873.1 sulfotransferase family protein [Pseudooceanicola antarcticus]SNY47912.1 Sulfotransferase family protein [Pseudooceanicola antarcticus]
MSKPVAEARGARRVNTASLLKEAQTAFRNGNISRAWQVLEPMVAAGIGDQLPEAHRQALHYLQLGCALYQVGDMDAARELNRDLPTDQFTPLRYRLSLRLRDPLQARRLRSDPSNGARELADFRTSAGLHEIWAHRYRIGFPLYAARWQAINFPKVLPERVTHAPLTADPAQDAGLIVLEQGLGDVLFHLAHIKAEGAHERSAFTGLAKYGSLVRRYFPKATFTPAGKLSDALGKPRAHLAADFTGRGYARRGTISPGILLDSPTRHAFDQPVFGICWRGGSGQNRREERHIPLRFLLDMLPMDARFLALQFDLTEAERKILQADPRCEVPLADITQDPAQTIDMIRPLAGVISVDSANWHMAGFSGVPLLAVMNQTAHWFWGPDADAASVFPSATTLRKEDLCAPAISDWIAEARSQWQARPVAPMPLRHVTPPELPPEARPLFLTGLPRSGTSMVMRALAGQGLWLGDTIPGNPDNPEGYAENRALRETQLKPLLSLLGADPRGIAPLPRTEALPPCPALARRLLKTIREEGYDGRQPWGYKDPKLSLLWPLFARAFPQATWVVVTRERDRVLSSIAKASFMRRHSTSPEFWKPFCACYDTRLDALRQSGVTLFEIRAETLMAGDPSPLEPVCKALGLGYDPEIARQALKRG